jgi:diaminohydroxyphosphoribosylaminopyrimidine deaminase/5-amino-6-(5-phosphoribosylamino)uracil reductase
MAEGAGQDARAAAMDLAHMRRALELARRGWGQTAPNPMVGAVVARGADVVGEGWHERFGGAHAEVNALREAGERARGATLYVTLEPCDHHGKTPPCTEAVLAAGISRVVAAVADPSPAGGGAERLRRGGVDVSLGPLEAESRELNAHFFHALRAGRPWVTLKLALSIDGALTDAARSSGWLTGPAARAEVHHLRAGHDAIGIGIGTVLCDDPVLTVRDAVAPRVAPTRVVFDRSARLPLGSRLARSAAEAPVVVAAERPDADRAAALREAGVTVVESAGLPDALTGLRGRGIGSLLVEGGAGLAGALLGHRLVDRLVIFQAPIILGAGAIAGLSGAPSVALREARRLPVLERRPLGDDLMTVYDLSESMR